jgi:hypothetical protein
MSWNESDPPNVINAFHWYDGFSLFTKSFRPWFTINIDNAKMILGRKNTEAHFTDCLEKGIKHTVKKMKNKPSLLGEFGLAFDMNNRKAFKTGNYSLHEKALSMYYDAVDANMLHSTIWNYSASNTNKYGDSWNDEDLSIFSEGRERAVAGWKRPYPMAVAGKLLKFKWDTKRKEFICIFEADKSIKAPSIIYLPSETFGASLKIETGGLRYEHNREEQHLLVYNDDFSGEVIIKVRL